MKTPDEIKKGLGCHGFELCDKRCPYGYLQGTGYDCSSEVCGDALIYIEQLEKKCHQLERELHAYKWYNGEAEFEWRGVKEE